MDTKLVCAGDKDNEFVFIGSILSTGDLNSTFIRDELLQDYLYGTPKISVNGVPLTINNYCSVTVLDGDNFVCLAAGDPTKAPTSGKSAVTLAIEIAVGIGAGLFLFLLVTVACLILCLCCTRRDVRSKYKEQKTEELHVQ